MNRVLPSRGIAGTATSRPHSAHFQRCLKASIRNVRVRAASTELEEIDPITGLVIAKASALSPVAGFRLKAGGLEWAYRKSEPDSAKASSDKPDVLLLHGIASSSYAFRTTLSLLGGEGYAAYAPDWVGHGDSDKPAASGFGYSTRELVDALAAFVAASDIRKPFALVVQGYVLGQMGLLYALEHPDLVDRLLILNTPLALSTKLRPELAAYKSPLPFMRPGNKPFDGMLYNMSGSPYAMQERDALAYGRPYQEEPAASAAVSAIMDKLDFKALLNEVDDGYRTWRKPSVLVFGSSDPFIPIASPFEWLESKRTNMKMLTVSAKLGHMPQEDYPEAIQGVLLHWLTGATDEWETGKVISGMKKRDLM